MSDAASALAAPIPIQYQGKEYLLSPLDLDMISMFERWLENRAFDVVEGRRGQLAGDGYERALSVVVEQCASGRYRYGGRAAEEAAQTAEGRKFLLFLMLAKKSPGMTAKLAAEIFDAMAAEVQAKTEVVNADPFDDPAAAAPAAKTASP